MATESLNLQDNMTPSLQRIANEAERLYKRMQTLKAVIRSLEKNTSLNNLKRELRTVSNEAKQTERAFKNAKREADALNRATALARSVGQREGILSFNKRYGGWQFHPNATKYDRGYTEYINNDALKRYNENIISGQQRRQRMIQANRMYVSPGRTVLGMNFEQRYQMVKSFSRNTAGIDKLNNSSSNLAFKFLQFGAIVGMTTGIINTMADTIKNTIITPGEEYLGGLTRVALTSDKAHTPTEMMDKLYDTAIRTRADSEGTISLYNRIAMSGVKASNDKILRFVETFNKTMAISGTTGQENRAVMLQLAQGMGSNRLGGDEFRSIAEQAPMFKYMLAKGLGVNPGALKQMGADGKLTAQVIMDALAKVQDQIDDIFKNAPWTIGQLLIVMQSQWQKVITHQLTGYIELRDVVKDFVMWLDTAQGQNFMSSIINTLNHLLSTLAQLTKFLAPLFNFIATHLMGIIRLSVILFNVWAISKVMTLTNSIIKGFQLVSLSGTSMFAALSAGATSFGAIASAVLGWIGLIIEAIVLAWHIGQKIADYVQEKRDYDAVQINEKMMSANKQQAWYSYASKQMKKQGYTPMVSEVGGYIGTEEASIWNKSQNYAKLYQAWESKYWAPKEASIRAGHDKWQQQNKVGKYAETKEQKMQRELNEMTTSFQGMMDSSKNVEMPSQVKKTKVSGGKLDSVGKIDNDVTLNTDSIQMLKAIAERMWVIQNEVTVPQSVKVSIDKSVDVEPSTIAGILNEGSKLAIASSMRGTV